MRAKVLIDNNTRNEWKSEWGLAIYIEHNDQKILLDAGTTGAFAENSDEMGIDLRDVDFGVLSHAHFDHSDGLEFFFERNQNAKFYLMRSSMENCYSKKGEDGEMTYIGIKEGYLEQFADRFAYVSGELEAAPGIFLVPHKTSGLEKVGEHAGMYVKIRGRWQPDAFDHEQSLVLHTERGLVVFNSCSHGGADVIIREVQNTWPGKNIYAYIGGLHLFRSTDEEVRAMAKRIRETGVELVCTGHCTGERAMELLREELGENLMEFYSGFEIEIQ